MRFFIIQHSINYFILDKKINITICELIYVQIVKYNCYYLKNKNILSMHCLLLLY